MNYNERKGSFQRFRQFLQGERTGLRILVGCTVDGAPFMLSRKSGFQTQAKAVSTNATVVPIVSYTDSPFCFQVLPTKFYHAYVELLEL